MIKSGVCAAQASAGRLLYDTAGGVAVLLPLLEQLGARTRL